MKCNFRALWIQRIHAAARMEGLSYSRLMGDVYKRQKYKSRPMWHKPSAGDVVSHLPGTIIKIMVEEGQAVEAGQDVYKRQVSWRTVCTVPILSTII